MNSSVVKNVLERNELYSVCETLLGGCRYQYAILSHPDLTPATNYSAGILATKAAMEICCEFCDFRGENCNHILCEKPDNQFCFCKVIKKW